MEPVSTIVRGDRSDRPEEARRSLVERAERIFYHGRTAPPDPVPSADSRVCPDGYTRISPPQPYRIAEGYYRRLAWKAALYAVAGVLLLLLALALLKSGLLRF